MRLFIGLDLPADVIRRIDDLQSRLRPRAHIAWSPAANLHVTTKFVGEWPEARLEEMKRVLGKVTVPAPFEIRVTGLGFFPNARSPRVFWAGIEAPPQLPQLARDTDHATASLGLAKEARAYSPHLTLARIRTPVPLESLHAAIGELPSRDFGAFLADRFFLYLSRPGPGGSVYTKLAEFPFS
jgi:2'-5' RNA ligase